MDRGCFECGSKRSSFQLVRVWCAPSGSLSSFWRVPRPSSASARYTRVKGTRRGLTRCVEEGGILLVSGTPRPSSRVPPICCLVTRSLHSVCWLSLRPFPLNTPACMCCCCCAGCAPRLLFFLFLLMARQIHPSPPSKVCVQICSNWGFDYPGPGISVGDRPGRMAKCMWGPFRVSIPGLAGLVWPVVFFPQPWGGAIKGPKAKGIPRDCNPAAQTARWKVHPPVRLRYGHTVYNKRGHSPDGRRTDR